MTGGILVPLFEKFRMEYSYLGATASQSVNLVRALCVAPFYRVQLIIRVHALTLVGQRIYFYLYNTLPSDVDPQDFTDYSSPFLTVAINSGSPPELVSSSSTDPGAFLTLRMLAVQSGSGAPFYGEFSGALLLRPS